MSENYFADLVKVNVSSHVEKKGQFSYLSWPFAVTELGKIDPTATWEVKRFDGMPYCKTECGHFVEVAVTCKGVIKSQIHPVLDARNKPIPQPSAFDINTSIQRCLVKAIALHGLGLYIYAGEDLPDGAEPTKPEAKTEEKPERNAKGTLTGKGAISATDGALDGLPEKERVEAKRLASQIVDLFNEDKMFAAYEAYYKAGLSNEMLVGVWEALKPFSLIRSKLTKMHEDDKEPA